MTISRFVIDPVSKTMKPIGTDNVAVTLSTDTTEFNAGTSGSAITLDLNNGNQRVLINQVPTITFANGKNDQEYQVRFICSDTLADNGPEIIFPNAVFTDGSASSVVTNVCPSKTILLYVTPKANGVFSLSTKNTRVPLLVASNGISDIQTAYPVGNTALIAYRAGVPMIWGTVFPTVLGDGSTAGKTAPPEAATNSFLGGRSFRTIVSSNYGQFYAGLEISTGLAYTWGFATFGSMGNGVLSFISSSPVSVLGGRSYSKIGTGSSNPTNQNVAAIEGSTGLAWSWGRNTSGQLGNGAITTASSPVSVLGGRSWSTIAVGIVGSAAIEGSTGFVYSWGSVAYYGSGGAPVNRSSPVSVFGTKSYSKIVVGSTLALAIEASTGNAYAWGSDNNAGQIGNGTVVAGPTTTPTSVIGGRSWKEVCCGQNSSYGIEGSTGVVYFWGNSSDMGGVVNNASSPVSIFARSSIKIGNFAGTMAILDHTGQLWLSNDLTYAGSTYTRPIVSSKPYPLGNIWPSSWAKAVFYYNSGIAILPSGQAWTWGSNSNGQIGDGTINYCAKARYVRQGIAGGKSFSWVSGNTGNSGSGPLNEFVLTIESSTGNAYAWGSNNSGQLGDGSITNRSSPVSVLGGRSYSVLAEGTSSSFVGGDDEPFMLAIEGSTGNAYAWGSNGYGQFGDGTASTSQSSPVSVLGGRSFTTILTGHGGTNNQNTPTVAALDGGGFAYTWGCIPGNSSFSAASSSPVSVVGGRAFKQLFVLANKGNLQNSNAVGSSIGSCFLGIENSTGSLYGWGVLPGSTSFNDDINGISLEAVSSPVAITTGKSFASFVGKHGIGTCLLYDGAGSLYGLGALQNLGDGFQPTYTYSSFRAVRQHNSLSNSFVNVSNLPTFAQSGSTNDSNGVTFNTTTGLLTINNPIFLHTASGIVGIKPGTVTLPNVGATMVVNVDRNQVGGIRYTTPYVVNDMAQIPANDNVIAVITRTDSAAAALGGAAFTLAWNM